MLVTATWRPICDGRRHRIFGGDDVDGRACASAGVAIDSAAAAAPTDGQATGRAAARLPGQ
jgi:hypothetical protein